MNKRCIYELIYWSSSTRSHEVRKRFNTLDGVWKCIERFGLDCFDVQVYEYKRYFDETEFYDILNKEMLKNG